MYGWVLNTEPEVVCALPDINQIVKNCEAQDKLIESIMRSDVEVKVPELTPFY